MTRRRKKSYAGQQMVMLLRALAHDEVVWARGCLSGEAPKLRRYDVQRAMRDVLAMSGFVEPGKGGAISA